MQKKKSYGIIVKQVTFNIRRNIIAVDDKNKPLMNEKIRSKEVRLIDSTGDNRGIVLTSEALKMAKDEARHGKGFDGLLKRYFKK